MNSNDLRTIIKEEIIKEQRFHAKKWKANGNGEKMFYDKVYPYLRSKIYPKLNEDELMEFLEVASKVFTDLV